MADVTGSSAQIATGAGDTQNAAESLSRLAGDLREFTRAAAEGASRSPDRSKDTRSRLEAATIEEGEIPALLAAETGAECAVVFTFRDGLAYPLATYLPPGQHLSPFEPDGSGSVATVFRRCAGAYRRLRTPGGRSRRPRRARAGKYRSSVATPIVVHGRLWGAVLVATTGNDPIPSRTEGLLTRAASIVAVLAEPLTSSERLWASAPS